MFADATQFYILKPKRLAFQVKFSQSYRSLLSNSLSSWRLCGLFSTVTVFSGIVGGLAGRLTGVDVKQLLGLELGRSALTGVGLILREGLVVLARQKQ